MDTRAVGLAGLVGVWLVVGCATTGESFMGAPIAPQAGDPVLAGGLVIHASEDSELSSPSFGVIEVSFQNRSSNWLRLDNLFLDFGSAARNQSVRIPGGDELLAWQQANQSRERAQADGADGFLLFLGLAGIIVGAAADTPELSLMGELAAVTLFTALDIRAHERVRREYERTPLYPDTHLFSPGLAIPPGLTAKRWVVIQAGNHPATGLLTNARLEYDTPDGVRRAVRLRFRSSSCGSQWQAALCDW